MGFGKRQLFKTRKVSNDFSRRLNDKALYWFLEFPWTAEQVISRKIDWTSIDNEVQVLLAHGS